MWYSIWMYIWYIDIYRLYKLYIIIVDSTWRNKYGQRWSKDRAGSVLDLMESILSGEVWCFVRLKRACSFTVGIYNDIAMMFNNAYLFNCIYISIIIYIYINTVYPACCPFCQTCLLKFKRFFSQPNSHFALRDGPCMYAWYRWIQETIERFQHPNMSVGSKLFKAANIV